MSAIIAWLIEIGEPPRYFVADGDWCDNPNHAKKFATAKEANAKASQINPVDPLRPRVRVCKHQWS